MVERPNREIYAQIRLDGILTYVDPERYLTIMPARDRREGLKLAQSVFFLQPLIIMFIIEMSHDRPDIVFVVNPKFVPTLR